MPTYTYRCADCGYQFDQFQKFSDDPLTDCPACSGKIRRVLHPVGVVFKGSGWYVTDSRVSSNGSGADKAEKPGASEAPAAKADGGDAAAKTAGATKTADSGASNVKSEKKAAASP